MTHETCTPVVTRFAPSPTGFLHIGGARTALFNWLYAKAKGGKMLLRIEDTDAARSTQAAKQAIIEGLEWLGLAWDGEIVFQSERRARHQEIATRLLEAGHAYKCFTPPQELEVKHKTKTPSPWRDADPKEHPSDHPFTVRLKVPSSGEIRLNDLVQGTVRFQTKNLDDFVILRSDGLPTYMLAAVVDDFDMGITHIIRGDDHLTNAAKQLLLYQALGWRAPKMAHIPLIHGADGAKLSKRHGALGLDAYQEMGILPIALRNYLARLGWSHGNDEVMSDAQMQEWFDTSGIGRAPARFDLKKLLHVNAIHLRSMPPSEVLSAFHAYLNTHPDEGQALLKNWSPSLEARFLAALDILRARAKTLEELRLAAEFLWAKPPFTRESAGQEGLSPEERNIISDLVKKLSDVSEWTHEQVQTALKTYVHEKDIPFKTVAHILRICLTGRTSAPGVYDLLCLLGREESLARLQMMNQEVDQ